MIASFQATMTIQSECGRCARHAEHHYVVYAGAPIPYPSVPDHWRVLDGVLICDQHIIMIVDSATALPITESVHAR